MRYIAIGFFLVSQILSSMALAQATAALPVSFDLTGIATSVIAGVFTVLAVVLPIVIQSKIKDKDAANAVNVAVQNSLGALQQAAETGVRTLAPRVALPGVPPSMVPGVQYILDHAGTEVARLGITPVALADKINAQIGLKNIATNIATAASPGPSPAPLAPVEKNHA